MTTLADAPPGQRPRPDTLDLEIVVPPLPHEALRNLTARRRARERDA